MDFDQAIAAHTAWKRKLARYLVSRDGSLSTHEVSQDNRCVLGKWIYGAESKYSELPEYHTLKREHARFHRAAAEVVELANSGKSVEEQIVVGSQSDYTMASSAVVLAIMAMKNLVAR